MRRQTLLGQPSPWWTLPPTKPFVTAAALVSAHARQASRTGHRAQASGALHGIGRRVAVERAGRRRLTSPVELGRLAHDGREEVQIRLLIIDDRALQLIDATDNADFCERVVARHHNTSTVLTSKRGPDEWLVVMSDALPGPEVDRFASTTHELVIERKS